MRPLDYVIDALGLLAFCAAIGVFLAIVEALI
jgi:hypothetical protein